MVILEGLQSKLSEKKTPLLHLTKVGLKTREIKGFYTPRHLTVLPSSLLRVPCLFRSQLIKTGLSPIYVYTLSNTKQPSINNYTRIGFQAAIATGD